MKDRREYSRLDTLVDAVVYIQNFELEAEIVDISESGVCFSIDTESIQDLDINKGLKVSFQFVDEVILRHHTDYFVEIIDCYIVYWGSRYDKTVIGCLVRSEEFKKYVLKKKLSILVK